MPSKNRTKKAHRHVDDLYNFLKNGFESEIPEVIGVRVRGTEAEHRIHLIASKLWSSYLMEKDPEVRGLLWKAIKPLLERLKGTVYGNNYIY
jgi:hypothetical protein